MAISCVLLASAAIIPVASTRILVPGPGVPYGSARVTPVQGTGVRVVTAGGMAGWQITLIAIGAAILAAALAVRLDRALTARPAGPAITAWRSREPAQRPGADSAGREAGDQDTNLPPATPAPGTPDIVEFGRGPRR